MSRILIKNGRVWDGERFLYADVLNSDTRVCRIGEHIDEEAEFIFDASGMTVSAGLVDIHMHMRGISCERFGTPAETSCFPFGVTAAVDASGEIGDKALLESFMLKNAVFVCARFENNRADFSEAEKMLRLYGERAVGIKVYFDTTVSDVADITPLIQVCEYAHKRRLKVMVHCSNSPVPMSEILNELSHGDILTHAFHGGENNAAEDCFESLREAQSRGVVIDAGMAGYVHTDFKIFRQAIKSGVRPDVISTDITRASAYTRGGRYGMTMCMNIARTAGLSEDNVFAAVTSNAAKALGKENEWGYLKVGRCADIAVFNYTDESFDLTDKTGNRLKSNIGYRCVLTVADGQVIYRN